MTLIPVFYGARFSLPLLALWLLFAAWPFVSPILGKRIASVEHSFPLRTVAFLALWVPTLVMAYQWTGSPANKESVQAGPYPILPAVDFLREHGSGETLLARKPHAAFMARMRFVPIEVDSPRAPRACLEGSRSGISSSPALSLDARRGYSAVLTAAGVPGFARVS
jgi:hypothetical protein